MCPRCEGRGAVNDVDLAALYDDSRSLADGAITVPGYTADGWMVRIFMESGLLPDKPIREFSERELAGRRDFRGIERRFGDPSNDRAHCSATQRRLTHCR